jgi:NAD(P)H dehydrogenase (quinone)
MKIVITGATGQLGRFVVERLLANAVPAQDIIATGRDLARLEPLAALGVVTRRADFADQDELETAFAGADRLLLVSTTTVDERFDNHRRAIDAARTAGVSSIVYVSQLNASDARMILAEAHGRTEAYLRASGVPFVILRNGWYLENYTAQLPQVAEHGVLLGSAGDARVSSGTRRDYADAAAAVLLQDGHEGSTYDLGGDAFSLAELATSITEELGRDIAYRDLPVDAFTAALTEAGLPPQLAEVLADADAGLRRGELFTEHDDLPRLLGRPATSRREAVRLALGRDTE